MQGKELLMVPWHDINLDMSMLSRPQQAHNCELKGSHEWLWAISLWRERCWLYTVNKIWRNNNIICRSEKSLEAILSTKLAGRTPQSLKEDDWEQKSIKGEELSDLLSSAIFINFIRGTSPCHRSLMLHGESSFRQYKTFSAKASTRRALRLGSSSFSSGQCSPELLCSV